MKSHKILKGDILNKGKGTRKVVLCDECTSAEIVSFLLVWYTSNDKSSLK